MLKYISLLRHKWLFGVSIVALCYLIYGQAIVEYLTFDIDAPDLPVGQGVEIRRAIFFNQLGSQNAIFELISAQSFVFPILIALASFDYRRIVKGYVKNGIGKGIDFRRELAICKLSICGLIVSVFVFVYFFVLTLSTLLGQYQLVEVEKIVEPSSVLFFLINNDMTYRIFFLLVEAVALLVNSYLCLSLMDYFDNFIRAALSYLGFIWLVSVISYNIFPYHVSPMNSLMVFAYPGITLFTLVSPYLSFILIFSWLRWNQYEIKS